MKLTREEIIREIINYMHRNYTCEDYEEFFFDAMMHGHKGFSEMTTKEIKKEWNDILN